MNPSSNETGLNLPTPVENFAAVSKNGETSTIKTEQGPAAMEQASGAGQAAAQPSIPLPLPPIAVPLSPPSDNSGASTQSATVNAADDGDLIEKEWVNKAKAIVEHTRDDPYRQSEELTVFKADYMKKRYDKTIKVNK